MKNRYRRRAHCPPAAFLVAYTCSGVAGLIYEVSWTRLLTLHIGHTTAAASAVVAAFMGGLAIGAAVAGRLAARLTLRQCLYIYALLEVSVAALALVLPVELRATTPVLAWAYRNGEPGLLFPIVRLGVSFVLILVPALALGATFPVAVRWFTARSRWPAARAAGALYAWNTAGAAAGALLAGFVLIPTVGVSGAVLIAVGASAAAAAVVFLVARAEDNMPLDEPAPEIRRRLAQGVPQGRCKRVEPVMAHMPLWLAAAALGLSGFAALLFEIAWTRVLAMTIGPTTYAFAATIAALILGLAMGSAAGAWMAGRAREPAAWLAIALVSASAAVAAASYLAGGALPRAVAERFAAAPGQYASLTSGGVILAATFVIPAAICLGAAFPLALATLRAQPEAAPGRFGIVYAVNTVGSVAGSLAAGFVAIPLLGLQRSMTLVAGMLVAASVIVVIGGRLPTRARVASLLGAAAAMLLVLLSPGGIGRSWPAAPTCTRRSCPGISI